MYWQERRFMPHAMLQIKYIDTTRDNFCYSTFLFFALRICAHGNEKFSQSLLIATFTHKALVENQNSQVPAPRLTRSLTQALTMKKPREIRRVEIQNSEIQNSQVPDPSSTPPSKKSMPNSSNVMNHRPKRRCMIFSSSSSSEGKESSDKVSLEDEMPTNFKIGINDTSCFRLWNWYSNFNSCLTMSGGVLVTFWISSSFSFSKENLTWANQAKECICWKNTLRENRSWKKFIRKV